MVERDAPGRGRDRRPRAGRSGSGPSFAGYRIESLLGRGAMSIVYLAEEIALERKVALKLLAPELERREAFRDRFLRESRLPRRSTTRTSSRSTTPGEAEGLLFISMRYVEGSDLAQHPAGGAAGPASARSTMPRRSPPHSMPRTSVASSTATSSRRTCWSARLALVYLADFGLTSVPAGGGRRMDAALQGHDRLPRARADRGSQRRPSGRPVLARLRPVRVPRRRASVPARARTLRRASPTWHSSRPSPPGLEGVFPKALAKAPDNRYATCSELVAAARRALGLPAPALDDELPALRGAGRRRPRHRAARRRRARSARGARAAHVRRPRRRRPRRPRGCARARAGARGSSPRSASRARGSARCSPRPGGSGARATRSPRRCTA